MDWLRDHWPGVNASLNATSGALLVAGWRFVMAKKIALHRACMLAACLVTTLFFVSYLAYHAEVGSVRFTKTGWIRPAYFTLLISHTALAVTIVPLVLRTLWFAASNRIDRHKKLARLTLPLWLYVSVTGIVVYWMLYRLT